MSLEINSSLCIRGQIESEIGGRSENQDSAGALDTALGTIVVVCDGMGGMKGGKTASMLAVQTIIDDVAEAKADQSPAEVLRKAFQHANEVILEAAEEDPNLHGMGTTATAIIINKNCATVAHIGDSRVYQIRGKRKVFRTDDHSMVFKLVKEKVLTEEQARLSSNSNIILKALGVELEAIADIAVLPFLKGDRFVLCTDGFWGVFPEWQFLRFISGKENLKILLWRVTQQVEQIGVSNGGAYDNYTAAVVDVLFESKIKPHMSKRNKIVFVVLSVLLMISLFINCSTLVKRTKDNTKMEVAAEYARELSADTNTDTTTFTPSKKLFLSVFADQTQKQLIDSEK